MDAIECMKTRRSIRAYQDKPVAKEVIEDIVDCGRLAATAINIQPWKFIAVTDPAMRKRIAHAHGLGACWVAGDKKAYCPVIRDLLGLPADYKLISLIPIGYPAQSPNPAKKPLSEMLSWV